MKRFLLGLLCGLVLAGLCGVIFVFSLIRLSDRRPTVAANTVLVLRLEGDIPEKAPVEIPIPLFEDQSNLTVRDVWSTLKRAAADPRVKAVVIAPRRVNVGWGKLQEIHQSLEGFRKSGKPLYAFLRFPGTKDYYLATAAERIYAAPEDLIDVKGLRAETLYLRNTLSKLGIEMDVVHAGKYKDAYDMFTRTSMSPETREVLNQLLDQFYSNLVDTIAAGRKKEPAAVRDLLDHGPFVSREALRTGLVDVLSYEDRVMSDLRAKLNQSSLTKMDTREYIRAQDPDTSATRFALVVAEGAISQGNADPAFGGTGITTGSFTKLIRRVKSDKLIRGVIVRIDSPGGDAIASDDLLHELQDLSSTKPTVISMSDVAASGGYFMAVTGDPILAYPNTITGSIGVITAKPNLHGLYDKLGISKDVLTRGKFAALDSDYSGLDPAERAKMTELVDATYKGFVSRVAAGRHRPYAEIASIAEGRVWLGTQAKERGLVDQLGGLDRAVEMLRNKAKISDREKIALVPYPPRRSLWEVLMSRSDQPPMAEARVNALIDRIPGARWIRPALDGGLLALMPFSIEVK